MVCIWFFLASLHFDLSSTNPPLPFVPQDSVAVAPSKLNLLAPESGSWSRNMRTILILALTGFVTATPPACFLSCINEVAHTCPLKHADYECLSNHRDSVIGCLVDICPYGKFESARDHFLGTCLEHQNMKSSPVFKHPHHIPPLSLVSTPSSLYTKPNQHVKILRNSKFNPNLEPEVIYDLADNGHRRLSRPLQPGRELEHSYSENEKFSSQFNQNKRMLRRALIK